MKSLHRAVKIAIIITAVIFVLLVLYFSYLIVFKGSEWKNDIHNLTRTQGRRPSPGQIVDRNGEIIAGRDGKPPHISGPTSTREWRLQTSPAITAV